MTIYQYCPFQNILTISQKQLHYLKEIKLKTLPKEWKLILMNDGSFTQNLNSLTGEHIQLKIHYKTSKILLNKKKLRTIWLEDNMNNKLTFARSLWPLQIDNYKNIELGHNKPIGQSIIESKIDIYKDIDKFYYGYSKYLDKEFKSKGPIWGRKYKIYYHKKLFTIVEEFFSPHLAKYFHFKN
uniref:Ycf21 n=1 Tax=Grateloupia turuturu TaxID=118375 RepID=A0A6B9PC71_9FLOR|nr:uncharacterized protein Ycf21 [Grateloupia turuturu]QHD45192.1 Ycf21 [Grateloupia turuturu]UXC96736.1 uncharacterized protein Ycf21 [Grateloupia turuturu]